MGKNIIQPGSVVDLCIEEVLPPNNIEGRLCITYIKKDIDDKVPEGLEELSSKISSILIGHGEDDVLDFTVAKLTVVKVYANVDEYNNREKMNKLTENNVDDIVRLHSIVSVIHNDIKRDYIMLEPGSRIDDKDKEFSFQECYTNSPLGKNLLGKTVGEKVSFDVSGVSNDVEITGINNSLVLCNTNNEMEGKKIK